MSGSGGTLTSMAEYTIKALTPETFADFAALVERNRGMFANCWCTWLHPDDRAADTTIEDNRAFKKRRVDEGIAHAALVYAGDLAIAWAEYGTPEELPGIHHRKEYLATAERLPDYRVTCIQVEKAHRGKGLASVGRVGAKTLRHHRPVVAVVHATGPIHLGRSGGGNPLAGPSIGADTLGAALRTATADDAVKAVVLRVDSPGGSYVASDAIRREVQAVRRSGRPVVASMASVAASGGYYIAMPADRVLANPGTLTGSIGVLAGKAVIHQALERLGVRRETVTSGTNADMFSTDRPFRPEEWQRLETWLDRVYADFTAKAAEDRRMPVERLRELAKGRVWTGADACDHGLVDRLGGLADAVDVACEQAGVARSDVEVRTVPSPNPVQRLIPPPNSDHATGVYLAEGLHPLGSLLEVLGLPAYGVLMMPTTWRLG